MHRHALVLTVLGLAFAACANKDAPGSPSAKPGDTPAAKSAAEMWKLAQDDDSNFRKTFTVTGTIDKLVPDVNAVSLKVTDDQSVRLHYASADATKSLAPGQTVTVTCTLEGTTPRLAILKDCKVP
jgi:hypothetical protein